MAIKFNDRTGKKYGRLTALRINQEKSAESRQGYYWDCECECGNVVTVRGNTLGKNANSCGCLKKESEKENLGRYIHGKSHDRLATIWYHMNGRCHNPNDYNYHRYGAKGITVCEEWRNDFLAFEKWALMNGYQENLSIDRVNVEGNYEPSNCRWAGFDVQLNNKRDTLWVEYQGEMMSLKQAYDLAKPLISYCAVRGRYHKGERNADELFKKNRKYRGN